MRKWLNQCNEDGVSNGDAITMAVGVLIAFILPIIIYKFC